MCTAHCKQHTTHSNYILKRCTLHYTLHNAYCTLKPYNTPNLTLPTANSSILLCRPPGKHTTVLEMEFCVVDFCLVTDTVYKGDYSDPESVLVLLTNDLVRGGVTLIRIIQSWSHLVLFGQNCFSAGRHRLQIHRVTEPRESLCNGLPGE